MRSFCHDIVGSPGESESVNQSLDSDAEVEGAVEETDAQTGSHIPPTSDSSADEEDQPEGRRSDEGELGPVPVILTEPESVADADPPPPALPDTEPPELDSQDEDQAASIASLNTNQSNNCLLVIEPPVSPFPHFGGRRLSVYKDRDLGGKPELI